ncbi:unnamed protein product [Protopolystoma xenopodis]|uniref:Uncharacterized protein n=1 Tax=Protopolystoma xenopodis TaxID=117903 RepID=A0A448WRD4_9PLAT|nr:unnamed protein product [Protopolystoma xenopodis]
MLGGSGNLVSGNEVIGTGAALNPGVESSFSEPSVEEDLASLPDEVQVEEEQAFLARLHLQLANLPSLNASAASVSAPTLAAVAAVATSQTELIRPLGLGGELATTSGSILSPSIGPALLIQARSLQALNYEKGITYNLNIGLNFISF